MDASTGIITTFAGSGQSGISGDGGLATSVDMSPVGVAIESSGNLLIADADSKRVRRVNLSTNIVTTLAGNGEFCFYGDGGTALAASLCAPQGLTADPSGNLLAYDTNNGRIRRINAATGDITTVAGGGNPADGLGDDAPATQATFRGSGLAADAGGNMFITDWSNFRVRRVDAATGIITTVAGSGGRGGNSGDGGPATLATLAQPQDVVLVRPTFSFPPALLFAAWMPAPGLSPPTQAPDLPAAALPRIAVTVARPSMRACFIRVAWPWTQQVTSSSLIQITIASGVWTPRLKSLPLWLATECQLMLAMASRPSWQA